MKRQDAEEIITKYTKPVFGYALKRCKSVQDAEDLSQEIILRAFRTLICRDDIVNPDNFIWTVAHNALSNYYRDSVRSVVGVPIDDITEVPGDIDLSSEIKNIEIADRLRTEIAYLSKLQRKVIISYYFEHRKQADIAKELNIPLGTVKWHLFEAKKELKRGIDVMRQTNRLKFDPIRFDSYGFNGSVGTKSLDEFFRSSLSQNICYCVRNNAKTVNEISNDLGVSPVYIEAEVEFLEKYGFIKKLKGKYIVNFIIDEPTAELLSMKDKMYKKAAELFANELNDELIGNGLLDDKRIFCNHVLPGFTSEKEMRDKNFLLWSLIPYIAACSGETDQTISFEDAATIRPDGGINICRADVVGRDVALPENYIHMKNFFGPMWNGNGRNILWQVNSEWCDRDNDYLSYSKNAGRILSLYEHEKEHLLTAEDYAWLSELGYVKTQGDSEGFFTASWQIVVLSDKQIKDDLLTMGTRIKMRYKAEFDALKAPYVKAVLDSVPSHLKKMRGYELQFVFNADGWFLLHCIMTLLNNGKLEMPTKEQRKILSMLIIPE